MISWGTLVLRGAFVKLCVLVSFAFFCALLSVALSYLLSLLEEPTFDLRFDRHMIGVIPFYLFSREGSRFLVSFACRCSFLRGLRLLFLVVLFLAFFPLAL
jgi:hypothetical protein